MKKFFLLMVMLLVAGVAAAKDLQTVVFHVEQMRCVNCEGKVKRTIAYEKGVKKMKTDVEKRLVTVTFDAEQTNVPNLIKGFDKLGYKAEVTQQPEAKKAKK